jgi:DNA-binding MarR family transcriptional regulator
VLFMLAVCETEGMLPSEISKMQGVMPNTVSSSLASLRDAGLIEQASHPIDGRKRVMRITPAGHDALAAIAPVQREFLEVLFDHFSDEEMSTLNRLLTKLLDNVQRMSEREETPVSLNFSGDPDASADRRSPTEVTP